MINNLFKKFLPVNIRKTIDDDFVVYAAWQTIVWWLIHLSYLQTRVGRKIYRLYRCYWSPLFHVVSPRNIKHMFDKLCIE